MIESKAADPSCALATAKPKSLSNFAWKLMQAEDRRYAMQNLNLTAALAAGMVSFFALLDQFVYPDFIKLFAGFRWACVGIVMILLMMIRSPLGKRYFRLFTVLVPLVPAYFIAMTIFVTRDPASIYYAGLSLCIASSGYLFRFSLRDAIAVSSLILGAYVIACAPTLRDGVSEEVGSGIFSNLTFLLATGLVVVLASQTAYQQRIREYERRERLRVKRTALRNTARSLRNTLDELEETEAQLVQSGKMASLGQLSAGVIHEIGNPLNHANQALFVLRRRLRQFPEDLVVNDSMTDIQDSIERMKEIVRDLREFSHKQREVPDDFPVIESIEAAVRILGSAFTEHSVALSVDVGPDMVVKGIKNPLSQVFINLLHNSVQAMAAAEKGRERHIRVSARQEADRILLSVRDSGPGIPAEIRASIFDPFFTTKDPGDGTGLGLSICFRIIESHRGTIQVDSDGNTFTEFLIDLPAGEPAGESGTPAAHHLPMETDPASPIHPAALQPA